MQDAEKNSPGGASLICNGNQAIFNGKIWENRKQRAV